ncbi:MAG: ATP-dependent DNA helicase RecG, partial [Ruminococcaceae bacterium]|nr:ATP-dependent DNA helicase RecG [Oscillospiraceae bacterium]
MNPSTEVSALRGIGEAKAKLLAKLDIRTVGDLLRHYPRGYEDRSRIVDICDLQDGEAACFRGTLCGSAAVVRSRGGRVFTRATVSDDTAIAELTFFNSPYVKDSLHDGESFIFYGTVQKQGRRVSVVNPIFESLDRAGTVTGRPIPLYPLTANLSNKLLVKVIQSALSIADDLPDRLPASVRDEYDLISYGDALRAIHAPQTMADVDPARRRLAFEELFYLAAALSSRRYVPQEPTDPLPACDMTPFIKALPFPLTGAQKRCIREALIDMSDGSRPMRRLIQGDVGSGKTAVAAACAYAAAQAGWQTVLMA